MTDDDQRFLYRSYEILATQFMFEALAAGCALQPSEASRYTALALAALAVRISPPRMLEESMAKFDSLAARLDDGR